jgi:hypothetical protein
MDQLQEKLAYWRKRRQAAYVWEGVKAAHYVLEDFQLRASTGTLDMSEGNDPHYVYNPYKATVNPVAGSAPLLIDAWERQAAYVLGVMRDITGMRVEWEKGGDPIRLYDCLSQLPNAAAGNGPDVIINPREIPSRMTEWTFLRGPEPHTPLLLMFEQLKHKYGDQNKGVEAAAAPTKPTDNDVLAAVVAQGNQAMKAVQLCCIAEPAKQAIDSSAVQVQAPEELIKKSAAESSTTSGRPDNVEL